MRLNSTYTDSLGDRMKLYENVEAERRFLPLLPVVARMDGRCFHSFTHGMQRPFDQQFSDLMIETALYLAEETNACMGYTQSDEITLAWHSTDIDSKIWFDGRACKMTSQLGALTTLQFYRLCYAHMPEYAAKLPTFDARVWQVPNRVEAANAFLWRERDATKNSISMAAQSVFSVKQLHGKNGSEMQEMLFSKGINWNDYPSHFKRGTFVQRRTVSKPFSAEELSRLPPKHEARKNPFLMVERSEWKALQMPPFDVVANRAEVIFEGAEPRGLVSETRSYKFVHA